MASAGLGRGRAGHVRARLTARFGRRGDQPVEMLGVLPVVLPVDPVGAARAFGEAQIVLLAPLPMFLVVVRPLEIRCRPLLVVSWTLARCKGLLRPSGGFHLVFAFDDRRQCGLFRAGTVAVLGGWRRPCLNRGTLSESCEIDSHARVPEIYMGMRVSAFKSLRAANSALRPQADQPPGPALRRRPFESRTAARPDNAADLRPARARPWKD